MVGTDLVVDGEVFGLDEAADRRESRGLIADLFLPNGTSVRMDDGNFLMVGRVADCPGAKPEWPAVAISDGENVARPWTAVRLMENRLPPFPETTEWVDTSQKNYSAMRIISVESPARQKPATSRSTPVCRSTAISPQGRSDPDS